MHWPISVVLFWFASGQWFLLPAQRSHFRSARLDFPRAHRGPSGRNTGIIMFFSLIDGQRRTVVLLQTSFHRQRSLSVPLYFRPQARDG